jgi:hypothetical protein
MRLRIISYNSYKLRVVVPIHVVQTVYLALYQALLQYSLLIWGGLSANALKPLSIQQRQIIRICLQKPTLEGSTRQNFKLLNVLPVDLLFKKIAILWVSKNIDNWITKNNGKQKGNI